jgi:hypothetical protein
MAADFLSEFSERLGNDGCNDYEWPAWVTKAQRAEIAGNHPDAHAGIDRADGREFVEDVSRPKHGCNWAVVDAVAHMLHDMADEP